MVESQGKMMRLKPADIDYIIKLIEQITAALTKTDFLTWQEQKQLQQYASYENWQKLEMDLSKIDLRPFNDEEDERRCSKINYNPDVSQALKDKLSNVQTEHIKDTVEPLQKKLDAYLIPERWTEIKQLSRQGNQLKQDIEVFIWIFAFTHGDGRTCYYDWRCVTRFPPTRFLKSIDFDNTLIAIKEKVIHEFEQVKTSLEYKQTQKPAETEQKDERSKSMITAGTSKENWEAIRSEYDISKKDFGKKINFVSDSFKRKIIFRDIEHAFVLASQGFPKPAIILAGGVIEELLRLYLENKNIQPKCDKFFAYIEACENNKLLKRGVSRLTDSIRDFRNLVHLANEETKKHTISKATAKGAVSSIFTIANDFQ